MLQHNQRQLELATEIANLGYWRLSLTKDELAWSANTYEIYGVKPDEFLPSIEHALEMHHPKDQLRVRSKLDEIAVSRETIQFKSRIRRPSGEVRHVHTKAVCETDADNQPVAVFGVTQDVTEHEHALIAVQHAAMHDPLTNLPNRAAFRERLEEALCYTKRYGGNTTLVLIDLDWFKEINDTLGHPVGDEVLRSVSDRFSACVRDTDTVARLGGDEFAIIQSPTQSTEETSSLLHLIYQVMTDSLDIEDLSHSPSLSMGVACAPRDGETSEELLKNADLALYQAKADGRGIFRFFETQLDIRVKARRKLEVELREGLRTGQFELYYQPLIDAKSEQLTCLEALIRWNHPERGLVMPGEFLELDEDIGLIRPMGEWVLRQACKDAQRWPASVRVAVNVSGIQFQNRSLDAVVLDVLATTGLEPTRLELEITESVLLSNEVEVKQTLHTLRDHGVRIVMDDFGKGYCSLRYLRSFPFDKIKLDRIFVANAENEEEQAIIRAVAGLGKDLSIETTAEGVETQAQLDRVLNAGFSQIQGFLYGRPQPITHIEATYFPNGRDLANAAAETAALPAPISPT